MSLDELFSDPNSPGLYVCKDDLDQFDPWRLPARATEDITLAHPRPDASLAVGPQTVPINAPQAGILDTNVVIAVNASGNPVTLANPASTLSPSVPWSATTAYGVGAQVTPVNPVGFSAAGTLFPLFLAILPGLSGTTAPRWTDQTGTEVTDGTVVWLCTGLYLP